MSQKRRRVRREPPVGTLSPPEMFSVPETGQVTVRLLSQALTMLQHPGKDRPIACEGPGHCPGTLHKGPTRFKAYCAAERWRDYPYEDWLPCVLEITEALWRRLHGRRLRGEVWTLYRQLSHWSKKELGGEHVDTVDDTILRRDVNVELVVSRVYGTNCILWGVEPVLDPVPLLEPSKDRPPPQVEGKKVQEEKKAPRVCHRLGDLMKMTPEERQAALYNGESSSH